MDSGEIVYAVVEEVIGKTGKYIVSLSPIHPAALKITTRLLSLIL